MKYKSVVATGRGSTEVLKVVENDLRAPAAGEARIKILAVGVCQDDIAARVGNRPFLPKVPFVPGSSRPLLLSRHTALHARSPRSEAEWEWVQVFPRAFAFPRTPPTPRWGVG